MAKGFFRELRHYKLYEISKELSITEEETKHLVGILKRYGIVKAVKASKPEYESLSNPDIVLTDVVENSPGIEYVFDFVGVVMVEDHVFKCYPKYIFSTEQPVAQLKQILKVIKKYNNKEQAIYLFNGEDDNRIFNRMAVALYLLEDYFQYGIYTNQHEIIETNGEGEILWERTINETFALIRNNRPYYMELQTHSTVDNEMDYIRRLHECVLSKCSAELSAAGILELFDIAEVKLTSAGLEDFGEADYIKYRLEREIQTQFVTRKQTLLKTIYTYIANERANQEDVSFSLYGTNSFNLVWEKVCAENFGSVRDKTLSELPLGVSPAYKEMKNEQLKKIIDRPVWFKNNPAVKDGNVQTLKPDLICIYPVNEKGEYCFGIYDAKYYCIDFKQQKEGYRVFGQPGVEDVAKQYLYQLAYDDFIENQGYCYVQNMFFCPQEEAEVDYGYVSMEMLHHIGNKKLENIAVVKLCAEEMYDIYLSGKTISPKDMTKYIPDIGLQSVVSRNFSNSMVSFLKRIADPSKAAENNLDMMAEKGKLIYPVQIKRELGAKIIYDIICSVVTSGSSIQRCSQIADAALEIEKMIKESPEQELRDETVVKAIVQQSFKEKDEISEMASGNSLDRLVEKVMELITEVYL